MNSEPTFALKSPEPPKPMPDDLFTLHARELLGKPPDWRLYHYESIGPNKGPIKLHRLTGAVAPLKKDGRPDWQKLDKATEETAYITPAEHDAWCIKWQEITGLCIRCLGRKEIPIRASVKDGTTYGLCPECKGTGLAPVIQPENRP